MRTKKYKRFFIIALLLILSNFLLNSCSSVLLNPKGIIGFEEKYLIIHAFLLMLIVVIPAILLTLIFFFKYKENNLKSKYNPNFLHSNCIELIVWIVPIIIIIVLSIYTYKSTAKLEPNKPLKSHLNTITIEVIALDWKWLFIYPEYEIATINEIVFPSNYPIKFKITSNSVMNSFFIPQLGSQIYAMPGMQTNLYLIANKSGIYNGLSANFSGKGFSDMKFKAISVEKKSDFNLWVKKVKQFSNIVNKKSDVDNYIYDQKSSKKYFVCKKCAIFHEIIQEFKK